MLAVSRASRKPNKYDLMALSMINIELNDAYCSGVFSYGSDLTEEYIQIIILLD